MNGSGKALRLRQPSSHSHYVSARSPLVVYVLHNQVAKVSRRAVFKIHAIGVLIIIHKVSTYVRDRGTQGASALDSFHVLMTCVLHRFAVVGVPYIAVKVFCACPLCYMKTSVFAQRTVHHLLHGVKLTPQTGSRHSTCADHPSTNPRAVGGSGEPWTVSCLESLPLSGGTTCDPVSA